MGNTEFKVALGKLIYKLRKERNISQEDLAGEADIDRTRIATSWLKRIVQARKQAGANY